MKDVLLTLCVLVISIPAFLILGCTQLLLLLVSKRLFYKHIGRICKIFLIFMGVRLSIKGAIPNDGRQYVIMTTHASFIEIFLLPTFMGGHLFTGVTAESNLKIPILGTIMKRANVLPIDRSSTKKAVASMKRAEDIVKMGYHMMLNPEGTRSLTGKLGPLKKGGFHLALSTNCSIIPVGIRGAFEYKPKNRKTFRPGPVSIHIGQPVSTEGYSKENLNELVEDITTKIKRLTGEIPNG